MKGKSKNNGAPSQFRRVGRILSVLVLIAIVGLAFGLGAARTFVVDATVKGLDIRFHGQSNYWDLGVVTICIPLDKPNLRAPRGSGVCDLRRYAEMTEDVSIEWRNEASAQVEIEGDGNLILTVVDQPNLKDGARIQLPKESWEKISVLSFVGSATLGQPAGSGETKLLLAANYQVREKLRWSARTETIKLGTVRKGESVSLMERKSGEPQMATVFGYITPSLGASDAMDVGIVSSTGRAFMAVRYFGGTAPAEIAPNWVDRTLSSPLILALTFLLSLGIGAAQFALPAQVAGRQARLNSSVRSMIRLNNNLRRRINDQRSRRR